jgi:glycosyltransferase involved in cell wall biosynthesis
MLWDFVNERRLDLERNEVLIISHDIVGDQMAGPGVRYYHLARALAQDFEVTLAVPSESSLKNMRDSRVLTYRSGKDSNLEKVIRKAKVVLVPAVHLASVPLLTDSPVPVVIDGYDPFIAETLFLQKDLQKPQIALALAYLRGDFFICASERQRNWWLGTLEAYGRVNQYTFNEDPSLRCLVDVVPSGIPKSKPQHTSQALKGKWPGIEKDDKVILWGGGLWPWLDPLTAIQAIARVWQQRQDVRLVFPGTKHPNPAMANIPTHNDTAFRKAQDLGMINKVIFFGEWIPYKEWHNVLIESDIALTLHPDTLESRLAFRSRTLDYIWAKVPIVATRGDFVSKLVADYGLGYTVNYESVNEVEESILNLLATPRQTFSERFERVRQELNWNEVIEPLAKFCYQPSMAPDRRSIEDLGSPFYIRAIRRISQERDHWRQLVQQYEQGKFIRLMNWLHRMSRKVCNFTL